MGGRLTAAALGAAALAWLAGIVLQLQQRELWPAPWMVSCIAAGLVAAFMALRSRRPAVLMAIGVMALAFASTSLRATLRLADELPAALEGRDVVVTGIVAALPQRGTGGVRFRFEVEQASEPGVPALLALGWYSGGHEDASARLPQAELRAGERWRFTVRLRRPHGNLNPGGFDYELALFEQGVRASGYVRDAPAERLAQGAAHPVERLRQRLRDAIEAAVPDRRAAGVLAALSIGDQGAIERDDWELFRATGVAHLMSISGLHVTMFAWLAGLAIGAAWRRSERAMLWLPVPLAARWGGLAAALGYAVFSGWGVPSQRTVWMLAAVVVLRSLGLRWPWPMVLLAAGVVVTAVDPWAMLQAGFWLSFVAVGVLMASEPAQREAAASDEAGGPRVVRWVRVLWRSAAGGLRTQVIATLALTPLSLVFFQQVSAVGLVANLAAIPLVTLVITPLALLGALVVPLWALGALAVQALCAFLGLLAGLPGAVWTAPAAPLWAQAAGLAGAVLLVLPLPWRLRVMALPLMLPLLFPAPQTPPEGDFELVAVDVGQGTAVLVRTRAHLLVYDAGPQYARDSDAGRRVLLPLLRARGERRIDRLVLSHRDTDHVGGAAALLDNLAVGDLFTSLPPDHPLLARPVRHEPCRAGQGWTWDGVRFEVLHPTPADVDRATRPNAVSCVIRISAARGSALLTGDIEREQELGLVDRFGDALKSDVLVVPHHGSRTSSIAEFLDRVRPQRAVIQAGYRNRFGHPAADVVARYRERRIAVLASPFCGAWRWSAASPQGICERERARRYWHRRFDPEPDPTAAPRRCEWPDTC